MQKTMKKRGNGTGSIEVRKDRTNPFIAKVGCSVIDQKTGEVKYKYKRIGTNRLIEMIICFLLNSFWQFLMNYI